MGVGNWLIELGFEKTSQGYEYKLNNGRIDLELKVVFGYNRRFAEVFNVYGICKTSRVIAEIDEEIPPACTSKEQVAAIIAFALSSFSSELEYFQVGLFLVGDANQDLHPMVIQQKEWQRAHDSRPHCWVNRDWFSPFRKQLRQLIPDVESQKDIGAVAVWFDGSVLTFDWGLNRLKIPAEGKPWNSSIFVDAKILSNFPKRFRSPTVVVDYWEGYLGVGHFRYGVVDSKTEKEACQ